jgi:multiple antibiotic resistance protein
MPTLVENLINTFLLVYAGLFPIINPIGGAPIFLGLTRHCSEEERNGLALRVTVNSFFLLLGSVLAGSYVLDFFGITLPIVRVTGGLMPITVGPGSIAVAITIGSQRPREAHLTYVALLGGATLVGLIAMAATIYLCYRFAEGTVGSLGEQGTNVLVRLSAFILMCIGIGIIWSGYSALMHIPS